MQAVNEGNIQAGCGDGLQAHYMNVRAVMMEITCDVLFFVDWPNAGL